MSDKINSIMDIPAIQTEADSFKKILVEIQEEMNKTRSIIRLLREENSSLKEELNNKDNGNVG